MIKKLEDGLRKWTPIWRPTRFKATLVGLLAAAFVIPLAFLALPYLEIFNDMAVQPKGKAQGLYGWFADQALVVERQPVKGTLPMNVFPYTIAGKDEEAAKLANETVSNPLKPTLDVLERGQKIFNRVCITCHGPRAEGDGRIQGPGLFPAPPSLHTPQAREFKDGRIFHVITRGQNKMPSYADMLTPEERWSVVLYVRALQKTMEQPPKDGNR
jgi:mono/diheme cytochrome c family protein